MRMHHWQNKTYIVSVACAESSRYYNSLKEKDQKAHFFDNVDTIWKNFDILSTEKKTKQVAIFREIGSF